MPIWLVRVSISTCISFVWKMLNENYWHQSYLAPPCLSLSAPCNWWFLSFREITPVLTLMAFSWTNVKCGGLGTPSAIPRDCHHLTSQSRQESWGPLSPSFSLDERQRQRLERGQDAPEVPQQSWDPSCADSGLGALHHTILLQAKEPTV